MWKVNNRFWWLSLIAIIVFSCTEEKEGQDQDQDPEVPWRLTTTGGRAPQWLDDTSLAAIYGRVITVYDINTGDTLQTYDLTFESGILLEYSISPNRQELLYSVLRGQFYELILMDLSTNELRTLYEPGWTRSYYSPRWSPDGESLVCTGGGKILLATRGVSWSWNTLRIGGDFPSFSRDGQKIVYEMNYNIYTMNTDGTNDAQLTFDDERKINPSWSPDGTKIACTFNTNNNRIRFIDAYNGELIGDFIMTQACGEVHWSPDGSKLAILFSQSGDAQIWIYPIDTVMDSLDNGLN